MALIDQLQLSKNHWLNLTKSICEARMWTLKKKHVPLTHNITHCCLLQNSQDFRCLRLVGMRISWWLMLANVRVNTAVWCMFADLTLLLYCCCQCSLTKIAIIGHSGYCRWMFRVITLSCLRSVSAERFLTNCSSNSTFVSLVKC